MAACAVICGLLAVAFAAIGIMSLLVSLGNIRRDVFDMECRLEARIIRLEREKDLAK